MSGDVSNAKRNISTQRTATELNGAGNILELLAYEDLLHKVIYHLSMPDAMSIRITSAEMKHHVNQALRQHTITITQSLDIEATMSDVNHLKQSADDLSDIPERKLSCHNDSIASLCDITIVVLKDQEPLYKVKASKYVLSVNCRYFATLFAGGFERVDDVFHYVLIEGETPESALIFLNAMSSVNCDEAIMKIPEKHSCEDIEGVVVKLGQVLEQEKQTAMYDQLLKSMSTLRYKTILELSNTLLQPFDPRVIAKAILKVFSTLRRFLSYLLYHGQTIKLPMEVLRGRFKKSEKTNSIHIKAPELWILARMSGHHELAEEIEPYLLPGFATYLFACKDHPEKMWWNDIWGLIVNEEQLNKSAHVYREVCNRPRDEKSECSVSFNAVPGRTKYCAFGYVWLSCVSDRRLILTLSSKIVSQLLTIPYQCIIRTDEQPKEESRPIQIVPYDNEYVGMIDYTAVEESPRFRITIAPIFNYHTS